MAKIRITTPATSANLGPGFDFLGVALSLYNIYDFEEADEFELIGFGDIKDNFVIKSYKYVFEKLGKKVIPVSITLVKQEIPVARGLGSSSSAIVAGVLAAIHFLKYEYNNELEIVKMMIELEGHPDNVLPCFYGGMLSTSKLDDGNYYINKMDVSPDIKFIITIPNYFVKTKKARKVLKRKYKRDVVTFNSSNAMLLPDAFRNGDIDLLRIATRDYVHEPYRKRLIKEWDLLVDIASRSNLPMVISGSGPTINIITNNDMKGMVVIEEIEKEVSDVKCHLLKVSVGTRGEVIE